MCGPFLPRRLLLLLWMIGAAVFTTHDNVWLEGNKTATRGQPVTLSCQHNPPESVQQVLWRKTTKQGDTTTMAAYNIKGYHKIEEPFTGRVSLSETLGETQLTIQSVNTEDEACYTCVFHMYPGAKRSATACLSVYVLPKPEVSHVTSSPGVTKTNRKTRPPTSSAYNQGDGTMIGMSAILSVMGTAVLLTESIH